MTHLGDITKISGYAAPVVDCIIGGSPCQDLSVAGKRAGLAGERSGLFMEQIRIVKEMRARDKQSGRTGNMVRPRFMVWENVPGALSSNHGEDFGAVLDEIIRVAEPTAPDIPRPKKWPLADAYIGDGWSVAYRILDAQFWGVPQRRRRIVLVADFGGHAAPEILFVRKSVRGDTAAGGATGQDAAGGAADGVNPAVAKCIKAKANLNFREDSDTLILQEDTAAITMRERCGCEGGGKGVLIQIEKSGTLATGNDQAVLSFSGGQGAKAGGLGIAEECAPTLKAADSGSNRTPCICIAGNTIDRQPHNGGNGVGAQEKIAYTLTSSDRHAVYDARGNGRGDIAPTLTGDHQNRVTDYTAIAIDCRNHFVSDVSATLQAKENGGQSLNYINPVAVGQIVRRLTPLECERLQGYPDGWTDIGSWTDSKGKLHKESSDSARYKALGNSIALPPWKWVLKRLCACYERDATMASLFDGIGGFPLIWEQLNGKGSCLWASEIDEFPMAVTRARFANK